MDKQEIQQKIDELESQREAFLAQVNQTLGEFKGRIAVYKELLEKEE
jgi:hypothetical protein